MVLIKLAPEVPATLHFESRWKENREWQKMVLVFTPATCVFSVTIPHASVPIDIVVYDRKGNALCAEDLHIGRTVDVCGKPTTLQSADSLTLSFLDASARFHYARYEALASHVAKFQALPAQVSTLMNRVHRVIQGHAPSEPLGGAVCVRNILDATAVLETLARSYPPLS
eukprot:ANDGO_07961.mRNA.1 hypothetical protein